MSRPATLQNRAQHLDRFMAWVITGGGMMIIAAVLGIIVFIGKEAFPLFRSPRSHPLALAALAPASALGLDESGKALMTLDPETGIRGYSVPDGRLLGQVQDGPALPWSGHTPLDARGHFAVQGQDGRVALGRIQWEKHGVDAEAAHWTPTVQWVGSPVAAPARLLAVRPVEPQGLEATAGFQVVGLDGAGGLVWGQAQDGAQDLAWTALPLPPGQVASCAAWSLDGSTLFAGTRQGMLYLVATDPGAPLQAQADFGQPVTALGFALGHTSLLVGGARGGLGAYQALRRDGTVLLQAFHHFQPMPGSVAGFMASLRDKRFLAWSADGVVVDHLTTERRLFAAPGQHFNLAALAPRGDLIVAANPQGTLRAWTLDAPHPEISAGVLWGKVHYESYDRPEYVWQSSGGTDDFEPKLSLVPLVFGTLKGTLYAMLFALPLAILGALYTSQFASPRLRDTIKPMVEIMAALPSVVLGFLAGLVLAPLLERSAVSVLLMPLFTLAVALVLVPIWIRMPRGFRLGWGSGREVAWLLPVILLGLLLAVTLAPAVERTFLGGDFRAWLLQRHQIIYDQRNSIVVGFAMGFAVIPIIFTISEDALSAVPRSLTSASLACGASPWQTAWRVVLPTASPGIFSAVMVGLGRAIGETMIVLMATGNTPVMDWSPFNGMRTLAANIAVETPEAPVHGSLYRLLFFTALLLFGLTFILNTVAELVRQRLRKRYESF